MPSTPTSPPRPPAASSSKISPKVATSSARSGGKGLQIGLKADSSTPAIAQALSSALVTQQSKIISASSGVGSVPDETNIAPLTAAGPFDASPINVISSANTLPAPHPNALNNTSDSAGGNVSKGSTKRRRERTSSNQSRKKSAATMPGTTLPPIRAIPEIEEGYPPAAVKETTAKSDIKSGMSSKMMKITSGASQELEAGKPTGTNPELVITIGAEAKRDPIAPHHVNKASTTSTTTSTEKPRDHLEESNEAASRELMVDFNSSAFASIDSIARKSTLGKGRAPRSRVRSSKFSAIKHPSAPLPALVPTAPETGAPASAVNSVAIADNLDWAAEMDTADHQGQPHPKQIERDQPQHQMNSGDNNTARDKPRHAGSSTSSSTSSSTRNSNKGQSEHRERGSVQPQATRTVHPSRPSDIEQRAVIPDKPGDSPEDARTSAPGPATKLETTLNNKQSASLSDTILHGSHSKPTKSTSFTINTSSDAGPPQTQIKLHGLTAVLSPPKSTLIETVYDGKNSDTNAPPPPTSTNPNSLKLDSGLGIHAGTGKSRTSSAPGSVGGQIGARTSSVGSAVSTRRKNAVGHKHRMPLTRVIFDPPIAAAALAKSASGASEQQHEAVKALEASAAAAPHLSGETLSEAPDEHKIAAVAIVENSAGPAVTPVQKSQRKLSAHRLSPPRSRDSSASVACVLQSPFNRNARPSELSAVSIEPFYGIQTLPFDVRASIMQEPTSTTAEPAVPSVAAQHTERTISAKMHTPDLAHCGFDSPSTPSSTMTTPSTSIKALSPFTPAFVPKQKASSQMAAGSPSWNRAPQFAMRFGSNSRDRTRGHHSASIRGPMSGRARGQTAPSATSPPTDSPENPRGLGHGTASISTGQPDSGFSGLQPLPLSTSQLGGRRPSLGARAAGLPTILQEPEESKGSVTIVTGYQAKAEAMTTAPDPADDASDCDAASDASDASGSSMQDSPESARDHQTRVLTGLPPSVRATRFQGRVLFGPAIPDGETAVVTKLGDEEYAKLLRQAAREKAGEQHSVAETERTCSSCGTQGTALEMTRCNPCKCCICASCLNSMLNITCAIDEGGPGASVCPACQLKVQGIVPNLLDDSGVRDVIQKIPVIPGPKLAPKAHPSSVEGIIEIKSDPQRSDGQTSVLRFDNCAWDITPETVSAFLPPNVLPNRHPHPIHILIERASGKSLDYLYVEIKSLAAAQYVIRSRQNHVMGNGTRARAVTISLSNHESLLNELRPRDPSELSSLLRLCQASLEAAQPAPIELPSSVVPPATPSRNRDRLDALSSEIAATPSSPSQIASRYLKTRYSPIWAALSIITKIKPGSSLLFWDAWSLATGIITALAKAVLTGPIVSTVKQQIIQPLSPPSNDLALVNVGKVPIHGELGYTKWQRGSLTSEQTSPVATRSEILTASGTTKFQAIARPEDISLQAKISAKIKVDLEKSRPAQKLSSGGVHHGIDEQNTVSRYQHGRATTHDESTGSMTEIGIEPCLTTPSKQKVPTMTTAMGQTALSPPSNQLFGTPKRDRQKSIWIEKERQRADREKDWRAEDEVMFHRFAAVFESVFGVAVLKGDRS